MLVNLLLQPSTQLRKKDMLLLISKDRRADQVSQCM